METHINEIMPLNKPQWEIWWSDNYQGTKEHVSIWRCHHSFSDGVSMMSMHLAMTEKYDITNLFPIKRVPWAQRMFLRLSFPFYLPKIFLKTFMNASEKNPLHPVQPVLTGKKHAAVSKDYTIPAVKQAAKSLGITINDLLTSCLSVAVKKYFI
jgi:hypothetical protein